MDTEVAFLILGAGPTGLGAARQLALSGVRDWMLIESSSKPGGLASSFVDAEGFTWDIGGHVQFSHYSYFDDAMVDFLGKDGWLHHERESWVWMRERFIPYPFQNNIRRLPPEDLDRCLQGLVEITRSPRPKPSTFRDWIEACFGSGIAEVFLTPYNNKVWAFPPEMMSATWVGERVAVTDIGRVLRNIVFEKDDLSWGPNSTFQFPKRGGTGAVWAACAAKLPQDNLLFDRTVLRIDLDQHRVYASDGRVFRYEHLISTLPLTELIKLSGQHRFEEQARRGLLFSSTNIVGLGLSGQPPKDLSRKCWMYFPEENCPFYRVTVFSNYSPYNVPDPTRHWSLMTEISESPWKPVNPESLAEEVIEGAINTRLIERREDVVSVWQYRTEYGYPTPGVHRDEALDAIVPFFEDRDVYSRGRFGSWKYEVSNQDHSFMQGVEVVERLLRGREEITTLDPNHANSRKHPWPYERWQHAAGEAIAAEVP